MFSEFRCLRPDSPIEWNGSERGRRMQSPDEIMAVLDENKTTIKSFGVRSLSLFGSAARNNTSETSDLDFLVEFEKSRFDSYMDLKEFLEGLFGRPVDLVLAATLKPRLREKVLQEAIRATGL